MSGPRVFLWAPEFSSLPGGVQQYTREVLLALNEIVGRSRILGLSYGACEREWVSLMSGAISVGSVSRPLRPVVFAMRALALCRQFRPDVILSTFPRFAPVGCICSKIFGVPFRTAAHGVEIWGRQGIALRASLRKADRILAVSEYTRRRIIAENGVPGERVEVLPNCVDGDRFHPGVSRFRKELAGGATDRVLLTVARLDSSERAKGVEIVLRSLPMIRHPNVKYLVVGGGDDRPRLERIAADMGVAADVRFAGSLADELLPDAYRACDCFVMPSGKEGFGIVFLEALATGKPVVAGDSDGSREPLCDGELGWLVDANSPAAVASAIDQALASGDPRCNSDFLRSEVLRRFGRNVFRSRLERFLPVQ